MGIIAVFVAWAGMSQAQNSVERAVEIWLNGRDKKSLTMLAELARDGSSDARMLLARIETMDLGPSPYRMGLGKNEARALFRDMSGPTPFGRTWIAIEAAEDNEYARIFLRSLQPAPRPKLIERLNRLGEHQATDYPTRIVALYGKASAREELRNSTYLMDDLKPYLDYLSGPPEPRGDGLAALRHITRLGPDQISADDPDALGMAGVLALGFGFGDHSAENTWRAAVEDWLMSSNSTLPVATLCNEKCGSAEAGACAFAMMALHGGYYEVIRIDSPFEQVIPQSDFLNSRRARFMALRRAAIARAETNLDWLGNREDIAEISSCAAEMVLDERARYVKN